MEYDTPDIESSDDTAGSEAPTPDSPRDQAFATPEQRDALTSPTRLEILGLFTAPGPLSVRELAERMGRSASSVHYHVNLMVEVGLLREVGVRPRGTRAETLYEPVRRTVRFRGTPHPGEADATLRTMAAAFRMAERDLEAALEPGTDAPEGAGLVATRIHFRADDALLAEVRSRLRGLLDLLRQEASRPDPPTSAEGIYSLTLALLPLRGRSLD